MGMPGPASRPGSTRSSATAARTWPGDLSREHMQQREIEQLLEESGTDMDLLEKLKDLVYKNGHESMLED